MLVTIRDETATGSVTNELTLDVLTETVTVRELIRSRVYQEVQDFNRRRQAGAAEFRGLVTPTPAERVLNGAQPRRADREVDWKAQFERACEAFERNGFFLLVDDRQAEALDEEVVLRHDSRVGFVKLVPLVGG
jgi:hypothetical protein